MNIKKRNHLRRYRKYSGLTQCDLAFLMELPGNASISHCENALGCPNFDIALLYELVFGIPLNKLYKHHNQTLKEHLLKKLPDLILVLSHLEQTRKVKLRINHLQKVLNQLKVNE